MHLNSPNSRSSLLSEVLHGRITGFGFCVLWGKVCYSLISAGLNLVLVVVRSEEVQA